MTTKCKECAKEKAIAAKENPMSFNHGVQCYKCILKDRAEQLGRLNQYYKEISDKLLAVDLSTVSGKSYAKDLNAKLARISANIAEING